MLKITICVTVPLTVSRLITEISEGEKKGRFFAKEIVSILDRSIPSYIELDLKDVLISWRESWKYNRKLASVNALLASDGIVDLTPVVGTLKVKIPEYLKHEFNRDQLRVSRVNFVSSISKIL